MQAARSSSNSLPKSYVRYTFTQAGKALKPAGMPHSYSPKLWMHGCTQTDGKQTPAHHHYIFILSSATCQLEL